MVWKLSITKRSNLTPLVHINLTWPEWLQGSHFQFAPTYLTLEFCFSVIFIGCFSYLWWSFRVQGWDYTPPHTALYLQFEHICCRPVKYNKLLDKYVLKPKFVVHHLLAEQPRLEGRSVGGNSCFQWLFEVEDWTPRQLTRGFDVGVGCLLGWLSGWGFFYISEECQKFVKQNWAESLLAKQENNGSEQMLGLNFQPPRNKQELTWIKLFLWGQTSISFQLKCLGFSLSFWWNYFWLAFVEMNRIFLVKQTVPKLHPPQP